MEKIFIDIRDEVAQIKRLFGNKDTITLEELFDKLCDVDDELEHLKEEFEDFKRDVEDNYRPITLAEQYDISDKDFIC